jgi:hypothetical protein
MTNPCIQEENIGKFKEFIDSTKGMRPTITVIACSIVVQIISFAFMWGSLTATVKKNTEYLWTDLTPKTLDNTRNIDNILGKLSIITSAYAEIKKK